MNDEQSDDAPEIPPALTRDEWMKLYSERSGKGKERVSIYHGQRNALCVGSENPIAVLADVNDIAALIALANESIRGFDDPRAILAKHIKLLRAAATCCEIDDWHIATALFGDPDRLTDSNADIRRADLASEYHELADALESYLPPGTPNV